MGGSQCTRDIDGTRRRHHAYEIVPSPSTSKMEMSDAISDGGMLSPSHFKPPYLPADTPGMRKRVAHQEKDSSSWRTRRRLVDGELTAQPEPGRRRGWNRRAQTHRQSSICAARLAPGHHPSAARISVQATSIKLSASAIRVGGWPAWTCACCDAETLTLTRAAMAR